MQNNTNRISAIIVPFINGSDVLYMARLRYGDKAQSAIGKTFHDALTKLQKMSKEKKMAKVVITIEVDFNHVRANDEEIMLATENFMFDIKNGDEFDDALDTMVEILERTAHSYFTSGVIIEHSIGVE